MKPPAATLEQVSFAYRGSDRPALRDIDLVLKPGEMVGIMGASGAGKSTLVKCLNRLVPSFEDGDFHGVLKLAGREVGDARVCELAPMVGMVFQDFEAQLFSTNAGFEVAFAMQQIGMARDEILARIAPALAAVGLAGFDARDPTSLSGGEKQRLAIAAVLALRPQVIIFDEPTSDLDPEGRAEVLALIHRLRSDGLSLIVIEHEAEELRACDRIIMMRDGAIIVQDSPAAVLTRLDLLEACGVHPPDLNRALALLGIAEHADSVEAAERLVRQRLSMKDGLAPAPDRDSPVAPTPAQSAVTTPLAEVRALSFAYANKRPVIDSINLKIAPGEFIAIVGQNGSGKTTLAKHLVGLLKPASGVVLLAGRDRAAMRPVESAPLAGYVFQNPDHQLFAATVEDEVAFGPRNFGLDAAEVEQRVTEVLRAVNLEDARARDPFLLGKGERQRLAVASVLALRPRILILDEPTTGLDYREQRRMMGLIADLNRAGIAIVIITHTPWLVAEYAHRVVLLRQGRMLFDGPVREFFAQDALLRESSFRPPEITSLARRFGFTALSVEEFVAIVRARSAAE
ncbi:MAG TPA: energy-coupling factor transporter ATPase [Candidatus Binataceae bacterium]|nr:energy-coupling factor transporter ATPase [Candidatus Binataceae bacterium]